MKQQTFEDLGEQRWSRFEALVEGVSKPVADQTRSVRDGLAEFPSLYLRICRDLAVATERSYSPRLIDRLNRMALAGHRALYTHDLDIGARIIRFVALDFPRRIRREWRFLSVANALFLVPGLAVAAMVLISPESIYAVMDASNVRDFEAMYDPGRDRIGEDRGSADDIQMFGFYIFNNIGIAFRCFAGGMLLGIGSIVTLIFNGILLGAVAAHIVTLGFQETFFSFVIGHGAFELTAIVISGAAGLKLGWAIVAPGPGTRRAALREAARESVELIYGVFGMLVIAALLEAFWSSKGSVLPEIKFVVGTTFWFLIFAYFSWAGRTRDHAQVRDGA